MHPELSTDNFFSPPFSQLSTHETHEMAVRVILFFFSFWLLASYVAYLNSLFLFVLVEQILNYLFKKDLLSGKCFES